MLWQYSEINIHFTIFFLYLQLKSKKISSAWGSKVVSHDMPTVTHRNGLKRPLNRIHTKATSNKQLATSDKQYVISYHLNIHTKTIKLLVCENVNEWNNHCITHLLWFSRTSYFVDLQQPYYLLHGMVYWKKQQATTNNPSPYQ
jgi:hypothetical protein